MNGTFLSLFSGIGGLDLAHGILGWECVGQVEWDPWCSAQLARHWPTVPRFGDAFAVDYRQFRGVDLVCAGWPCQPHSHAGKRKGSADEREGWPAVREAVRQARPRWVVGENVGGVRSSEAGRYLGGVLRDLASLGFDAEWTSLRASDIGAPHRRERFFLLAERAHADHAGSHPAALDLERDAELRNGQVGIAGSVGRTPFPPHTDLTGLEGRPEPRRSGGDAIERDAGTGDPTAGWPQSYFSDLADLLAPHADRGRLAQQPASHDGATERLVYLPRGDDPERRVSWGPYRPAIERWQRVMLGPAPAPLDDGRLSAAFVTWMMGLPQGWLVGKRNQQLKALGNAVVWQQAAMALEMLGLPVLDSESGEGVR